MSSARECARGRTRPVLTGPTILTISRIILAIAFAIFAMFPCLWARITAIIIFAIATITDKIDGIWARKKHLVTDLGAFLDPLADKTLTSLAFLILVYQNIVPLWVFAIILVRDYIIDGLRMALAKKTTIAASIYGKLKTASQTIAIFILFLSTIIAVEPLKIVGDVILYISLALTIISGLDYIIKATKK